jgi:selenocysteine-specific elongation factor
MSAVIGTAGHIDHGKTALVRALTGTDTDRLPEEKRRGITIDLGFAELALPGGARASVVDVPGHEDFIRNMVAGAAGVDVALLVVAADEGVMPQTREHLRILELLRVRRLVVALTKSDLVDAEWLELVSAETRELLASTGYDAPVVAVSAVDRRGLDLLLASLAAACQDSAGRAMDDLFRLPIDRVFTVHGTGTVVTGTVWSGELAGEAVVRCLPQGAPLRVRGFQVHGRPVPAVRAGDRAALALATDRDALSRGMTLVTLPAWNASAMLTVRLRLLPEAPRPLRRSARVRLHLGTAEVMARALPLEGSELPPGGEGWVQLRLEAPVTARAGDHFVLRSYSPVHTIGGGTVAEAAAPKRTRITPASAARFGRMLSGDPGDALAARLEESGWDGEAASPLPLRVPLAATLVHALAESAAARRSGDRVWSPAVWADVESRVLTSLDEFHAREPLHPGLTREELRRALPPALPVVLLERVTAELVADGRAALREGVLARPGFLPELDASATALQAALLEFIGPAGLEVPAVADYPPALAGAPALWPLLRLLERDGTLVALAPGHFVLAGTLRTAVRDLKAQLEDRETLRPADFRSVLGLSRKHLLPLLEYLDRAGVTRRLGEVRRWADAAPAPIGGRQGAAAGPESSPQSRK